MVADSDGARRLAWRWRGGDEVARPLGTGRRAHGHSSPFLRLATRAREREEGGEDRARRYEGGGAGGGIEGEKWDRGGWLGLGGV